jgi:hypothetical protein
MTRTSADQRIRTATASVVVGVAAFVAAVSYSHIYDLALAHGQTRIDAGLMPLSVDGLILAASFVHLDEARLGRTAPLFARFLLWLGVTATVAANIAYGLQGGAYDAIVSAWPAVSFLSAAELLMYLLRVSRVRQAPAPRSAAIPPVVPARTEIPVPAGPARDGASRTLEDEFAAEIAAGRIPGVKLIQRRMGGGQPAAYKYQERLRALAAQPA